MKFSRTITTNDLRHINRTAVLELLRREGPISRTELSERLDISLPTVMRIVDELFEEDLLKTVDRKEWSGGRKRSLVEFNFSGHLAIGVDLGGTKMFGALTDIGGNVLKEINIARHATMGEESYDMLLEILHDLTAEAATTGKHLLGMGIGIPGIVATATGTVISAPAVNWENFPLKERLVGQFDMPIIIDNDVNLSALGELWFGVKEPVSNLVLVTVGTGIGAGIIVDGSIYRGSHDYAGEIGFLLPSTAHLGGAYRDFGPLERMASGTGVADRARRMLAGEWSEDKLAGLSAEDVFEAARRGERWAVPVVDETVDLLAQTVATLAICFDPDVILLGGGVARSADLLIEPIKRRIASTMPNPVNLQASILSYRAAAMGAIVNLVYQAANFYVLRKLSGEPG